MLSEFNYLSRVMGCDFAVTLIAPSVYAADRMFTDSFAIAKKYEKIFSRFDESSELSMLNLKKTLIVSKEFSHVLQEAKDLHRMTQGLFNPLAQVERIGYDVSFEEILQDKSMQIKNLDYDIDVEKISSRDDLVVLRNSQKLDFGGFLKGYVAQLIANALSDVHGAIINIGGDIYVHGRDQQDKKVILEIENPLQVDKKLFVDLENKSLCTSGVYKRKWKINNESKHHIIDIHTRDSAQNDIVSVSVVDDRGSLADALATTAVTLGVQQAEKFLRRIKADFVIICRDGKIIATDIFKKKV